MKIYELLTDESKWVQRTYAVDGNGKPVTPLYRTAVRWCIIGGLRKCYSLWEEAKVMQQLMRSLLRLFGRTNLSRWQDEFTTTFAMVQQLLRDADA